MPFQGEQCGEENVVEALNVVLRVKPRYDMFAPDDIARANFCITMMGTDVFDNPNKTKINVLWYSSTEMTDDQFCCFVAIGSRRVLKKGILFPFSDNDITTRDNNDITHLTGTCYS